MNYNPTDIFTTADLKKIITKNEIHSDIIIRGENIKKLEKVEKVNGFLGISDSTIESFGTLKEVKGNLFISTNIVFSNIKSLDNLEFVGGDLILRYSNVEDLGALKKVGGKLSLRDTNIRNLGSLEFVGGDLFLPKRIEKEIDLANLIVKGKIKFWNDSKTRKKILPKSEMGYFDYDNPVPHWKHKYVYSFREIGEANSEQLAFYRVYKKHFLNDKYIDIKGNDNYSFILFYDLLENHNSDTKELQSHLKKLAKYYPKTKIYGESAIIEKLEKLGNYEKAWDLVSQKDYINVQKIIEYENKLNRELLNGDLIAKLGGFSHLTEFGQKNINEIKPFANQQLEKYKLEKGTEFFNLFVKDGKPITTTKTVEITNKKSLFGLFKKPNIQIISEYDSAYYEDFFLSKAEYEHYKAIDDYQAESGYKSLFPHVVEKSIFNQCRLILKQAEDLYRETIGMPKVGEGWISETELFYKISDYFKNDEVIHHASPKWLGRQHLDIYLPKLNIGIEYQGAQHYEPIEFFGGQEAFEKTVERDKRKKQLCEKHKCHLIYVDKGYEITEIITEIEKIKTVYNTGNRCTSP
ncbi:hypothetical protein U8527_18615 [Kordia algicida OT-1]|uniref:Uncharacterized protein n=1 Tax=Kordia algicida OT-1 TaxID=391587 RepID=A9DJ17_9FLAO|nr:hypothetical protein [Kordia algicida]EDP98009.1 hypothetical protein KAOT1_12367 [Kordia algicida OT-1]